MPPEGNLLSTLQRAAADRLDADFLRPPGQPAISYREVFERAARLATVLHERGVTAGDRIVSCIAKSPDAVVLYLGCLHAGAVHVPLNPAFTADELAYYVDDADPALVVVDADLAELIEQAETAEPAPLVTRQPDDLAALLYTSGTTGRPKGAALTHANLWHNAWGLHDAWHFTPDDRLLHTLPLFHVHGLFVALHCAMLSAIPVELLDRFDTDQVVDALPDATVLMGVPTHYHRLLDDDRFDATLTAGIRLFTCGSAPLPDSVFAAFTERTGHRICERYGMSEAGIMTSNPYDGDRVAGTVGFALRDVALRVSDRGIVEVRGPHLFQGYWRRPEATADAFTPDGWFATGDVGSLDAEGRLTLQGRAGDMIISGGENIYPKEIELVLDGVDGIRESAVIGVPHPDFGEGVVAVLVVEPDFEPATATTALQQKLARFKHPKIRIVVDALPRNAMGKIQKNVLRADYADVFSVD
ncbi:MAG: AMP-binding protein [Acidimicrobiales bacterium]